MSSTGPDRYYGSLNKTLRSSPGESQGNVFFQTGQGGRTVLPPLSSAFPTSRFPVPGCSNQYTPRSSPAKFEINPQLFHPSWSPPPSFPNYETQERYSQPQYNNYYPSSSRTTPPISGIQHDPHRKLPRLATNSGCYTPSHIPSSNYTTSGTVHSPASYQTEYDYSTSSHHGYHNMHSQEYDDHPYVPSMNPHGHMTTYEGLDGHRSNHGHRPSPPPNKSSSQPLSISPTDDSTVKKKRKRADPAQLKVLNETYNRTAFPSTEERLELAKALDMTPRSVQIWFQNKRQSMRQTNRQSSAASSSAPPYTMASQDVMDDLIDPYGGSMEMAYAQKHSSDASRSHHSASRRRNQEEAVDPRNLKWSSRGY